MPAPYFFLTSSPSGVTLDLKEVFLEPAYVSGVRSISLAPASELFNLNYSSTKAAAVSHV